jgi:hypothetical protein
MKESLSYVAAGDALANNHKLYIDIYHINSKKRVKFKAFLTEYSEALNTSYDVQHFVMNQEPVRKLKSTMRQINISLDIPSVSAVEAEKNMGNVSLLANMLYPEQVKQGNLSIPKVGGSPVFKMRLVNFIRQPTDSRAAAFGRGTGSPGAQVGYSEAKVGGLLGYIDGYSWSFDMESGFFLLGGGRTLPKNIKASFTYYPVHEKSPAWIDGKMNNRGYPYGEGMISHEDSDRLDTGYSSRPTATSRDSDKNIPAEVRNATRKKLFKAPLGIDIFWK